MSKANQEKPIKVNSYTEGQIAECIVPSLISVYDLIDGIVDRVRSELPDHQQKEVIDIVVKKVNQYVEDNYSTKVIK